jgi:glyoxylate carboligase
MREIKEICLKVIPDGEHRPGSVCGDYWFDDAGILQIRTSDLGDTRMNMLVLIHEIVEVVQTEYLGISEEDIRNFDLDFEVNRDAGNVDEPGDDPRAPYVRQHCIATAVERMMAALLDVSWKSYEAKCNEL